jgi:hypothetical protein
MIHRIVAKLAALAGATVLLLAVGAAPASAFGVHGWTDPAHDCYGNVSSGETPAGEVIAYTQKYGGSQCGEMGVRWHCYGGTWGTWSNHVTYVQLTATGTGTWNKIGAGHRLCIGCATTTT